MKIKRQKKTGFLETCAASDLAFLLIIYFLVIAGFNITSGFIITLPAKNSVRIIHSEDLLRFEMNSSGNIIYSGGVINLSSARNIITASRANNPDIAVILSIDSRASWQNVVSFIELAHDLNIEAFSFSMINHPREISEAQ
ncbi:MAG: biopolymer transporter ExbD [Treponema sp.]|nr:biopolymer transporter ExbD [Treponema sp.]